MIFRPPANPARDPWPMEVADDTLHIVHNLLPANMDDDKQEEILTASREGVNVLKRRAAGGGIADAHRARARRGEIKMGRVADDGCWPPSNRGTAPRS